MAMKSHFLALASRRRVNPEGDAARTREAALTIDKYAHANDKYI
jgi:hypothetical protein